MNIAYSGNPQQVPFCPDLSNGSALLKWRKLDTGSLLTDTPHQTAWHANITMNILTSWTLD